MKLAMRWKGTLTTLALTLATGCSLSPESRVVRDAVDALGGAAAIESVRALVLEGAGEAYDVGQNASPQAPLPAYEVSRYRRSIDFSNRRWRQEIIGLERFPPPFPSPSTEITALDGQLAFDVVRTGEALVRSDPVSRARQAELYHHPVGILQATLDPASRILDLGTAGGEHRVQVITAEGFDMTLSLDSASGLPSRVQSLSYDPILGDVVFETAFADYAEVDGLRLPRRLTSRLDRYPLSSVTVSSSINAATGDLEAPIDLKSQPASTPVARVAVEDVGRGIWYLTGESHHSMVVEFADHLTLIEAPQNDVRTLAVIETARQLRPDKALTEVINTHHHFDHAGGIRSAISEGLTIITHEANGSFYRDIASRPHRLFPDALENGPRPAAIETVSEPRILSDATRTIEIYPISGNLHADTLLMVYVPAERILALADVYSPPAQDSLDGARFPHVQNLLENIQSLNLNVDRVLPLHGRIVPFQDLTAAAEAERRASSEEASGSPAP